jgi:hypothetical protein
MSADHAVATDWRGQLQERIRKIRARGGPRPQGEPIVIPTSLSEADLEDFAAVAGRLNDLPFGDAPAGTLEIFSPARWEDGTAQLVFFFRPEPPENFGSTKGVMKARGPEGESHLVGFGVDFNALPGLIFPTERNELEAIKKGLRHDAVVPISPDVMVTPGDRVIFIEAKADPFGTPIIEPGADSLWVTLTDTIDQNYPWAGRRLYRIVWDPNEVLRRASGTTLPGVQNRAKPKEG